MSEKKHKVRDIFVDGPIDPQFVATSLEKHATRLDIGAHELFLGQVRADDKDGLAVEAIDYTAYRDMALERMTDIREEAFAKWPSMTCLRAPQPGAHPCRAAVLLRLRQRPAPPGGP